MDAPRLRPIQLLPRDPAPTLEERVSELEANRLKDQLLMALMQANIERLHARLGIEPLTAVKP